MKFRIRFVNQVVGAFVLLALVGTVAVLVLLGINQRWFAKNYYYRSDFNSAGGISIGMPITFKGFQIGKVTAVELTPENHVRVEFYIEDTYIDRVNRDSVLQHVSSPFGLGGGMRFHPGKLETPPPPEGSLIPSWASARGRELVRQERILPPDQGDPLAGILSQAEPVLANLDDLIVSLDEVAGTITPALQGRGEGPVQDILTETSRTISQANEVIAQVDRLTAELQVISKNMVTVSEDATKASAVFADPTGLVPRLLDPRGSIATFLDDGNELYDRVDTVLARLETTVGQLEAFMQFVGDSQPEIRTLLTEGRQTLDTGQQVLESVRSNPLIRRRVPPQPERPSTLRSYRDEEF